MTIISQVMKHDPQVSNDLEDDEEVPYPLFLSASKLLPGRKLQIFESCNKVFRVILMKITAVPLVEGQSVFAQILRMKYKQTRNISPESAMSILAKDPSLSFVWFFNSLHPI